MAIVSELKLSVTRTINLGNYESVKIEGSAVVSKDSDDDTPQKLRKYLLDEVHALLDEAEADYVPARRRGYRE